MVVGRRATRGFSRRVSGLIRTSRGLRPRLRRPPREDDFPLSDLRGHS